MRLPDLVAYQGAVQHPSTAFSDPELRSATAATSRLGLPRAVAGNFAVTYQLENGSQRWAVRCFHREVADRASRYAVIGRTLAQFTNGPVVPIVYIDSGVRVGASWFPITKMPWLDGYPLNRVVESSLSRPGTLLGLERRFVELVGALRRQGIAHGDLQHGNVLVDDSGALHLVDYDGMYVPGLKGRLASESGDPNYQHPGRTAQFDTELDNFAALVIVVALRALASTPGLWRTYNTGDNLLFRRSDFADVSTSQLFRDLRAIASVRDLSERLAQACQEDYSRVPRLEDALRRPSRPAAANVGVTARAANGQRAATEMTRRRTWRLRRSTVQEAVAISADGSLVASAARDGKITIRDASGRTQFSLSAPAGPIVSLALTRAGDVLAATLDGSRVSVWNATSQRRLRELTFRSASGVRAALSSGGGWLATSSHGAVQYWSVPNGRQIGEFRVPGRVSALAVSSDGRNVAASVGGRVLVWRTDVARELCRLGTGSPVRCLSLGSGRVLTGTARGDISLWDLQTGTIVMTVPSLTEEVVSVALAPDLQHYVGAGANGGLWLRRLCAVRNPRHPPPVIGLPRVLNWFRYVAFEVSSDLWVRGRGALDARHANHSCVC